MTSGSTSRTVQRVLYPTDPDSCGLALRDRVGEVSWDRTAVHLRRHSAVSLASYFAAFPAAIWMRIAGTRHVTVSGVVDGVVELRVSVRSLAGVRSRTIDVSNETFAVDVSIGDGDQWVWVALKTGAGDATVRNVSWDLDDAQLGSAAVCVTTHDRPDDCVRLLEAIAADADCSFIRHVVVVDQGSRRLRDSPGFERAKNGLDGRLRLIEQSNLGGSGGFSRGLLESVRAGVDYAVLVDDDVRLDPESIRRMISLATRARRPLIVGAHMLDLLRPTRLHTWGERVDVRGFEWAPVLPHAHDLDLAHADVTAIPSDVAVGFNGWWLCLIPTVVVRELGAAMPFFIKWDDTEFSLRAAATGVETVTLPGAAVWHLPWTGKDDGLDWQAYFQLRNRIVTALLHARGAGVLRATLALDVNHVLCMQYGSAAARRLALSDVLRGPRHLDDTLVGRISDVRELMARAGQVVVADDALPSPHDAVRPVRPQGAPAVLMRLLRVVVHQCRWKATDRSLPSVDLHLAREDGKWWSLGLVNSATVESATGQGAFIAQRDSRRGVTLLRDAVSLRLRLWREWRALSRAYREAAPGLTSVDSWAARFEAGSASLGKPSVEGCVGRG